MEENYFKKSVLIGFTFLMGMIMTILPFPTWTIWYQPSWVFMILVFWISTTPYQVGIGTAFTVGLFLDLLKENVLGRHALAFTCLSYFFIRFQLFTYSSAIWQQIILVLIGTTINCIFQYWIVVITDSAVLTGKYWMSIISTTLFWPSLRFLLNNYQHRFKLD
ncbi:rod shape-determining protein MreD [Coxiella endosymbiont of Amblyomma sculptum]|uniref:rod shape-determining protein MreD n=1 Tax=Coxiella endosymbiont of Amblyomma sculptum TaxID=2487929 RepID=UPI00132F0A20|nr:rod shape-determining protein MreD [Coxiella endosymbiont of Amblyomma sculptum]QHG92306.1 rod shape-determining protein MreD [Coxiella endosymbiont of Amblyomma sculptum]